MNQPDLGLKIAELRQQKGLTQEKLAEYCEVSTRTIGWAFAAPFMILFGVFLLSGAVGGGGVAGDRPV